MISLTTSQRQLLHLVGMALGVKNPDETVDFCYDWHEIYDLAERQAVLALAYEGMTLLPENQRPDFEFRMQWYADVERQRIMSRHIKERAAYLVQKMREIGFSAVVIKGPALAAYYPKPELRATGDIDLWVWREGLPFEESRRKVIDFVLSRQKNHPEREIPEVNYHHIDMPCFRDVEVEAHFVPSYFNNFYQNKRFQKWCEIFQKSTVSSGFLTTPDFNVVFTFQHLYRHLVGEGVGLRQVLDCMMALRQDFDREEAKKTIESLGMVKVCRAVSGILCTYFNMTEEECLFPPSEREADFLMADMWRGGNFGHNEKNREFTPAKSKFVNFLKNTKISLRYVTHYPSEILWSVIFRVQNYFWRKKAGYRM